MFDRLCSCLERFGTSDLILARWAFFWNQSCVSWGKLKVVESMKAMETLQDLIEEAKLRTVYWALCIFAVSYFLTRKSSIPIHLDARKHQRNH